MTEDDKVEVYLGTVERLEPGITSIDQDAALTSIAISLKRLADTMGDLHAMAKEAHGE